MKFSSVWVNSKMAGCLGRCVILAGFAMTEWPCQTGAPAPAPAGPGCKSGSGPGGGGMPGGRGGSGRAPGRNPGGSGRRTPLGGGGTIRSAKRRTQTNVNMESKPRKANTKAIGNQSTNVRGKVGGGICANGGGTPIGTISPNYCMNISSIGSCGKWNLWELYVQSYTRWNERRSARQRRRRHARELREVRRWEDAEASNARRAGHTSCKSGRRFRSRRRASWGCRFGAALATGRRRSQSALFLGRLVREPDAATSVQLAFLVAFALLLTAFLLALASVALIAGTRLGAPPAAGAHIGGGRVWLAGRGRQWLHLRSRWCRWWLRRWGGLLACRWRWRRGRLVLVSLDVAQVGRRAWRRARWLAHS